MRGENVCRDGIGIGIGVVGVGSYNHGVFGSHEFSSFFILDSLFFFFKTF